MLNLHHVRTFLTVLEEHSFHAAGRRLGLSQPSVSQHIKKLENALGANLLRRDVSGLALTAQGRLFCPLARRLLATAERASAMLKGQSLRVGASGNIGVYLLPAFLKRYAADSNGAILVEPWIASNPEIAESLVSGELDVGLMEWWDQREGFEARVWRQEPLVVIVAPDHPWASRAAICKEELTAQPMVGGEPGTGTGRLLTSLFGQTAAHLRTTANLGSTAAVKEAVKAGLGVSLVFQSAVLDEMRLGTLHVLAVEDVAVQKSLWLILPAGLPETSPARAFASLFLGS